MTLEDKIRDVLARLATLSEAPTSTLDSAGSHGVPESKPPAGVRSNIDTDQDRPPPKDRSLADWYAWQFARAADNPHRLLTLYLLAERDYMTRRYHVEASVALRSGELTDNDAIDGGAAEQAAIDRVVDLYEGMPAVEVAVHEYTTEAWVKKARRLRAREPYDGRPRPEFYDWSEDRRSREVAALANRMGQRKAANRLGIAKSTLQRYWPAEPVAA